MKDPEAYLLQKPGASSSYPFGPGALVFKVGGKMFALLGDRGLNLKCDPVEAETLRDLFEGVSPGYHMNKRHWNTVLLGDASDVPAGEVQRMIDHSYDLVFAGLPKRVQRELATSG